MAVRAVNALVTAKRYSCEVVDGAKANIGNANEFHGRQHHPFTSEMGLAQKIPV
jgi:hypothetical protein